jgi:hypothetical protein
MIISDGIPAVPRKRKLSEFRSEPSLEEKKTRNSVEQKRSKLPECRSEPFLGRENNSEQYATAENFEKSARKEDF